jgi:hypothetical protein
MIVQISRAKQLQWVSLVHDAAIVTPGPGSTCFRPLTWEWRSRLRRKVPRKPRFLWCFRLRMLRSPRSYCLLVLTVTNPASSSLHLLLDRGKRGSGRRILVLELGNEKLQKLGIVPRSASHRFASAGWICASQMSSIVSICGMSCRERLEICQKRAEHSVDRRNQFRGRRVRVLEVKHLGHFIVEIDACRIGQMRSSRC